MRIRFPAARVAAAAAALALGAAACGGAPVKAGPVRGGTFKIAAAGDVDSMDPGKTAGNFGMLLMRVMVRTLVAPPAVDGETGIAPVPDIAAEAPAMSSDGKRYVITLRPDVKYPPDVAGGRAVESRDIRYAIERTFFPSVAGPYAGTYFRGIFLGDEAFFAAPGPALHITGIDVSSPTKITFTLKRPIGDFLNRLALPMAAPVPEEYAKPFDAKPVSDYGANFAATGPYQIERSGGAVTGYTPGEKIALVRNAGWDAKTDPIRKAYPDRIEVTEGLDEATRTIDRVLDGEFDYAADTSIPADRASDILNNATQKNQLFFNAANCMRYVALNTTVAPFDNVKVRQAVATLLDKDALLAARGGKRTGDVAGHLLMPGMPGFGEAGGRSFDAYQSDGGAGSLVKAQELMKEAGFPAGRYDPEKKLKPLLLVGISSDFHRQVTDIVVKTLEQIGILVDRQEYKANEVFSLFTGVPTQKVAVSPNAAWCWLYPDAATTLPPLFDGRLITESGNRNFSMLNDAKITTLLDQSLAASGSQRADLWAQTDKAIMDLAPVVPWLWERVPSLVSKRVVNYRFLLATSSIDLAVVAVKPTKKT